MCLLDMVAGCSYPAAELQDVVTASKLAFRFFGQLPTTNILHLEVVVEVKDETDAVSNVGRNAVKYIVGMRERLSLGAGGQDGAVLLEIVQLAALRDRGISIESNNDGRQFCTELMAGLIGVVLKEGFAELGCVHVTDLDRLEGNGSPNNFLVEIKQGVEFILDGVWGKYE